MSKTIYVPGTARQMRQIHLSAGMVLGFAFLLSAGVSLTGVFAGLPVGRVVHDLHSADKVYGLLAAVLNLLLGTYWSPALSLRRARLQEIGSVAVLLAPIAFLLAFVLESASDFVASLFSVLGIILVLFGTGLHAMAGRRGWT